jgi:hypothetical protein
MVMESNSEEEVKTVGYMVKMVKIEDYRGRWPERVKGVHIQYTVIMLYRFQLVRQVTIIFG